MGARSKRLEEIQQALAELEAMGLVDKTGEYRTRADGSLAPVYKSTELGQDRAVAGQLLSVEDMPEGV